MIKISMEKAYKAFSVFCYCWFTVKGQVSPGCTQLSATQDTQFLYSHESAGTTSYPSNTHKCWQISADSGLFTDDVRVQITIVTFVLEDSTDCELDYVRIFSGTHSDTGSQLLSKLCGYIYASLGTVFTSIGQDLYMEFVTDDDKQEWGFKFKYKAVLGVFNNSTMLVEYQPVLVDGCQYLEAMADKKSFTSHPEYSGTLYPNLYNACWIIHVSPEVAPSVYYGTRNVVQLNSDNYDVFALEFDASCSRDYVEVFDGEMPEPGSLISRICTRPVPTYSLGEYMHVSFTSDKSERFSGFRLYYSIALADKFNDTVAIPDSGCRYLEATHTKKHLYSHPGFDGSSHYPSFYHACWVIIVANDRPNDVVQLIKKKFKVESDTGSYFSNCDPMDLYEGTTSDGRHLGKYCGTDFHARASNTRYMYIRFISGSHGQYYGFKLEYYAVDRADAINGYRFPVYGIVLLAVLIPIAVLCFVIFILVLVNYDDIKKKWNERSDDWYKLKLCKCCCEVKASTFIYYITCNKCQCCSQQKSQTETDVELNHVVTISASSSNRASAVNPSAPSVATTANEMDTADNVEKKRKRRRRKRKAKGNKRSSRAAAYSANNGVDEHDSGDDRVNKRNSDDDEEENESDDNRGYMGDNRIAVDNNRRNRLAVQPLPMTTSTRNQRRGRRNISDSENESENDIDSSFNRNIDPPPPYSSDIDGEVYFTKPPPYKNVSEEVFF